MKGKPNSEIDPDELVKNPQKVFELAKKRKKEKKLTLEEKIADIIREGTKLGYALAGKNTTDFDKKNLKLASPRFLGVTKETKDDDEVSCYSNNSRKFYNFR